MFARKKSIQLAAAVSLVLTYSQLQAQDAPGSTLSIEEVVVTGSFIKGTPEDAAMSVEVISFEDLQNIGRPSNVDLVKTMTESGQVAGEANRYNAFPIGAATVNLRNLGQRFTTVVFNGRRFPEQFSPATGRFNNIAWIPNAAIGSVEVLKVGGSVTYGADAVGGVVNYITRKNFEGLEVSADYRYIEDSDGDYNADIIWGKKTDGGNMLVTFGYQHRGQLRAWDRDWARQPFLINNDGQAWGPANNPGTFLFQTQAGGTAAAPTVTPGTFTSVNRLAAPTSANFFTGTREMGVLGTVRDPNCAALGGFAGWGNAPLTNPICYMQQSQFENLVEESDSFQLYAEFNHDLTDNLRYHAEASLYYLNLPDIAMHPSDSPLSFPLVSSAAGAAGQSISGVGTYYVDGANPGIAQFLNNFSSGYTAQQIGIITGSNPAYANNRGRAAFLLGSWRPFATGGNPLYGVHDPQENTTKMARTTQQLSGDLPQFWGTALEWSVAATYNYIQDRREARDMLVDRLQNALNGLGGANCNNIRAGLAGSTCLWFNPMASAVAGNYYTGVANPGYVSGLANDIDLIRWLYVPIWLQRIYTLTTLDTVVSGDSGIALPGGNMQIAFGAQVRYGTERMSLDDLSNRGINPCPTIGVTNCAPTARTGVLAFTRPETVLGAGGEGFMPTDRRFPVYSFFAEAKLPVFETLEFSVAGRWEKFISDLSDTDNDIFVPALSARWQIIDEIAVRASWGKTFSQVNPPRNDGPTVGSSAALADFGLAAGAFDTFNYDNTDVEPMTSKYFDVGFVVKAGGFRATVDYYNIRIEDFARTLTAANILQGAAVPGTSGTNTRIDCNSPLLSANQSLIGRPMLTFLNACPAGTTQLLSALIAPVGGARPRVDFFGGTAQFNAGELQTSGIDLVASQDLDVFGGVLTPSIDATYILKWELGDLAVNGVTLARGYDGVGFRNSTTGRIGQAVPEWRAGFSVNYRFDRHNVNVSARYIPSIVDDNPTPFSAANNNTNANVGDSAGLVVCNTAVTNLTSPPVPAGAGTGQFGAFCANQNTAIETGREIDALLNIDVTYRVELLDNLSMTLTINNLLDEDPSFARTSINYDAGFGSPLGRNFRLGVSKKF